MHPMFLRRLPVVALALLAACGGDDDPPTQPPAPTTATVTGVVRAQGTNAPLAGATVTIGTASATSGADGTYRLEEIDPGDAIVITARLDGYDRYRAQIAVPLAGAAHDIALGTQTIFEAGDVALYVPRDLPAVRGVILTLGGPDTRAIATGDTFALDSLVRDRIRISREWYLPLTVPQGLALMGAVSGLPDGIPSDTKILNLLSATATATGHPELATAPILVVSISSGAPQGYGFALRHPERTIGFILRVPSTPSPNQNPATHEVPGYVIVAQNDTDVNNVLNRNFFDLNRAQGARWAFVSEPGVGHMTFTPSVQDLMKEWVNWTLATRLRPGSPSTPLLPVPETSGWLGDIATGTFAGWADYAGDRTRASWLPTQPLATAWRAFGGYGL